MSENISKLKLYSLGIVVEAKKRNSWFIKVYPVEELPMANGKIADLKTELDVSGKDVNDNTKTIKSKSDNIIVAKWMPEESNRATPPDMQPSEHVLIWKFADTDEFFWSVHKHEPNLRRHETVKYSYCNKPKGIDTYDDDSSYWIQWSNHDKHIHLHTAKNDGEPVTYDVKIDTAAGNIKIEDDIGNFILFDSVAGLLHANFNTEVRLEAPLVRFIANHVVNETPLVTNTGNEETEGNSLANVHINCVD